MPGRGSGSRGARSNRAGAAPTLFPAAALLLALLLALPAVAQVSLTPTRLVFDRGGRALALTITNTDDVERTYALALVDRVMAPDGRILAAEEALADPALAPVAARLQSARPYLLLAPERVTIAPGRSQTVRIRAAVPPGTGTEYRTHLTVTALPPADAGTTAEQLLGQAQFAMRVSVAVGLSVPVILRAGRPEIAAAIAAPELLPWRAPAEPGVATQETALVRLGLERRGGSALFGNVEVRGRDGAMLGQLVGVGVYPEIDARRVDVPLARKPRAGERLTLVFVDGQDQPGRRLAEATLVAP